MAINTAADISTTGILDLNEVVGLKERITGTALITILASGNYLATIRQISPERLRLSRVLIATTCS